MSKLLKMLKNSAVYIILIIVLLIIQAASDLSLPSYISEIVDTGIRNSGITTTYPDSIRKSALDKILLFAGDEEQKTIKNSYNLVKPDSDEYKSQKNKNPNLIKEDIYFLNDNLTESQLISLSSAISNPQLIAGVLSSKEMVSKFIPNLPAGTSIFDMLNSMDNTKRESYITDIKNKFSSTILKYDDSTIKQMNLSFVKGEYVSVGLNTDSIKNQFLIITGLKMLGVSLISITAAIIVGFLSSWISAKCARDMRYKVFDKVLRFSNREFDEFSTASLITRSTNDVQQIQMFLVFLLRMVIYAPIIGIGAFLKVLNSDNSMSWVIGIAVIAILTLVITMFALTMPKFQKLQKLVDKVNLVAREILTGLPVIRAFSTEKHEEKRFDDANKELTKTNLFVNRAMTLMMPTMMFIMNAISVLIIWVGSKNIDAGNMLVGDLMAFIQYTMQIMIAFLMLSMVSIMMPRAAVSIKRIGEVLDKKISIKDPDVIKSFDDFKKGTVEFKDVYFRYPNAEEDVLNNISFTAKPGQTTAFIGSTGSGKSTLINLIPRFFDVTGGKILVDGVDIRDVSQKNLREKIGYVPQKGSLFSGTIASNIAYGSPDMSDEDILSAAQIAQATEFIDTMPDKYETAISQGGTNVSGGQKQRLSIARAISKKPEILIFDDSFSALDFKTDSNLRRALSESVKDSTVFIVAQRISTVINSDQIIVLDDGHIAGIGTHKELLKSCEIYQQIASSQLSKEELENE